MGSISAYPSAIPNPAIVVLSSSRHGGIGRALRAFFGETAVSLPSGQPIAPLAAVPDKTLRRMAGTAGKWKQQQAAAGLHWPRISEAELLWSDGHVTRLVDLLQSHYLISPRNAEQQVKRFFDLNIR